MSRVLTRVMLGLVAISVLAYFGFQFWRYAFMEYPTQPAEDFVVTDTLTAQGVAVRQELVLEGYGGGNLSYLYQDGTRVSKEMPVARVVGGRGDITRQMRRDELQEEIDNLSSIGTGNEAVILQSDTIAQRVYTDIDTIAQGAAQGDLTKAQALKFDIQTQLNRRNIATGKDENFDGRIATLQRELLTLGSSGGSTEDAILAPQPGYFTKTVDGLEESLTPDKIDTLTVDEFVEFINAPEQRLTTSPGKLITSHVWYFAVVVNVENADKFVEGKKVELDFGLANTKPFVARIHRVVPDRAGARTVVVFECDQMSEELSNLRTHKVDIALTEMVGYRFPKSCKRYLNDQLGVYVLETTVIRFKPVKILYENDKEDYVVFSQSFKMEDYDGPGKSRGLERHDEVILGGSGLYDGKVVKQFDFK